MLLIEVSSAILKQDNDESALLNLQQLEIPVLEVYV